MTKPSTHFGRVIFALVLAPLLGVAAGIFALPYFGGSVVFPPDFSAFIEMLLILWITTLPVAIVFGAITHLALLRLNFWPMTAYTIVGMLLGPIALIAWNLTMSRTLDIFWLNSDFAWLGAIVGGTTALAFRLMVYKSCAAGSSPETGTGSY